MPPIVNCPECGEEYLATTLECADCGVPLVADASQIPAPTPVPVEELPPIAQLTCVRTASLSVVQGLSDALVSEGITHRIEAFEPNDPPGSQRRRPDTLPYGVYVRAEDAQRASTVDLAFMRTIIPDLPDAPDEAPSEGGCPACGTPIASDAAECSDCGLALIDAE